MLPAGTLRVSAYHGQASLPSGYTEGVQRGSPPQADAEGLVVDSPQDEGCPPTRNHYEPVRVNYPLSLWKGQTSDVGHALGIQDDVSVLGGCLVLHVSVASVPSHAP